MRTGQRQYGSATKSWRFDTAGVLTSLVGEECSRGEIAFKLSFEPPGKARRRTPDNWNDFEPCIIRLAVDRWTVEPVSRSPQIEKLSPNGKRWHQALVNTLAVAADPNRTTKTAWFYEAAQLDLVAAIAPNDPHEVRERQLSKMRKYVTEIREAGIIAVKGEEVSYILKNQQP